MSTPVLSGDLSAFSLPDILNLLNTNRKTGSLRCAQGEVWKSIEWQEGAIVFARSSRAEDRLGSYLVSRGKITSAQFEAATKAMGKGERLGKALISLGVLAPNELFEAVRAQVTEIVYSLFTWNEGHFDFEDGAPTEEKISLNASVMNLIMEGTRRLDEWSRIRAKIQSDRMILAPVRSIEEVSKAARLSEVEKTVLSLVDGRRTVGDIVSASGLAEFEGWQALHTLLSAGVIRAQLLAFDK